MDFLRLSTKQRSANAGLIAVGLVGIAYGTSRHEYASELHAFAYFLGMACLLCGATALVAKRRHLAIAVATLPVAIGGGVVGFAIWDAGHPGFHYSKGEPAESLGEQRATYGIRGVSAAAPVVVLTAAVVAALRKRSD